VANNGQNNLWINDGLGGFSANNISGDLENSIIPLMSDLDSDGDLDIYVPNNSNDQNYLWINN